jgi:DNA-binding NarL/FixJ family response regulator
MTRGMLAEHLEQAGFIVFTAETAASARQLCEVEDPDGVVLDIDLGFGPTGFDLADSLRIDRPDLGILFLTNLPDPRFAGRESHSMPAGIGYLRKENLVQRGLLVEALDAVLRGRVGSEHRNDKDLDRPLRMLSGSQVSVLRMVALGLTNQQISDSRGTSPRAVQGIISRALAAIGLPEDGEGAGRVVAARQYILAAGFPLNDR